jgi:enoyl-[acyl-carrier protein] reductase II
MTHPALQTQICDTLGIEVPIIQAGMGFIARAELAAAVSLAGGLGMIGSASLSPEELRAEIRKVRERTDRPFGVDILFATSRRPAADVVTGQLASSVQAHVDVVFEERVPVLASGLGDPGPVIGQAHDLGMTVIALVGNTKNARRVVESGVDIVVAQGYDGGGHTGRVGTLSLLPAVLDAVDVPVIAAGGIGDGRGIAAVLAMGGVGVWMGTRFVASEEAFGHEKYKNRIAEIDDEGTIRTRCFSGKPCRMIRNQTTAAWEAPELEARIRDFPKQFGVIRDWLGEDPYTTGRFEGKVETGALAAGQSSAVIRKVLPTSEIIQMLVAETEAALDRLSAGRAGQSASSQAGTREGLAPERSSP